jgi:hypothetical protein
MLKKQSIVVMLFLFVFVLSSCSGFVIQGDFNKGLEKLKSLESYKVTIKNEIISSSGVSKGESIISNTSFYKGIIEFMSENVTTYYYLNNDNNVYEMIKPVNVHIPNELVSINFEKAFGIVDFNKEYDTFIEDEIVYVEGLLGIEKAQFKVDNDGILYEIFEIKNSSVGNEQIKQTISYSDLNKVELGINFIEPDVYENMWIKGIYKMGFEIQILNNSFIITNGNIKVFEYRSVTSDVFIFYSSPYTYTYNFSTKSGNISEKVTSGSRSFTYKEYIDEKVFMMTDSKPLTLEAVNEVIKFLNAIYGKNLKI